MAVSKIVTSVEQRFENDPKHFTRVIKSFVKKEERIITANDASLQKALFTFSHEYFATASFMKMKTLLLTVFLHAVKRPHSLASAVASNRASAKKHYIYMTKYKYKYKIFFL